MGFIQELEQDMKEDHPKKCEKTKKKVIAVNTGLELTEEELKKIQEEYEAEVLRQHNKPTLESLVETIKELSDRIDKIEKYIDYQKDKREDD
jgi:DNA polymerase III delta prime subunit